MSIISAATEHSSVRACLMADAKRGVGGGGGTLGTTAVCMVPRANPSELSLGMQLCAVYALLPSQACPAPCHDFASDPWE